MEIKEPTLEFEIPFKKNKEGNYIIFPKHIGGKNCLRDLANKNTEIGYVYLLRIVGTDLYKIGVSTNPKRRVSDIASYLPYDLELLAMNQINKPYQLEQGLIDLYQSKRIKNEWFCLSIENAKEIMITLHNRQVDESRQAKKYE